MKEWLRSSHPEVFKAGKKIKRFILRPAPFLYGLDYGIFLAEKLAEQLPLDVDCVIGIPRSGLMFASVIATKRGLPLSTPVDFTMGIVWQATTRPLPSSYKKVLIVDDSVGAGGKMEAAVKKIKAFDSSLEVRTACLLTTPGGDKRVESYQAKLTGYPMYEWNIASVVHSNTFGGVCVDMDGVLTMDGTDEPYIIPNFKIDAIITSRPRADLEKTEKWLAKNGVRYERLMMREDGVGPVEHKIACLKKIGPWWFWESDPVDAETIAKKAKLPVVCTGDWRVYR